MLAIIASSMLTTLTITSTIPLYSQKEFSAELFGLLKINNFDAFPYIASIVMVCGAINTDLLLIILINRYDIVFETVTSKPKVIINTIYALMVITNHIQCYNVMNLHCYIAPNSAIAKLTSHTLFLYKPLTTFYHLSRFISFIIIIWLNIKFSKRFASNASSIVVRLHRMITRATIADVICEALITRIPMLVFVISQLLDNNTFINMSVNLTFVLQNSALLANMVTTIWFVKPYRSFVVSLLCSVQNCGMSSTQT
uniref:G_PROTEIN_RECEP_F1_2 domain-containing protein n=1 Tax=Panagrellus redivivus TaxID=6233 RepID=A0A7E4VJF5_PANRE